MTRVRDFDEPEQEKPSDDAVVERLAATGSGGNAPKEVPETTTGFPTGSVPEGDDPFAERIALALELRSLGFHILPVKTNSKDPASEKWEQAVKNEPAVFLRNPGTHNYGVLPPAGVFCWDVDKDVPAFIKDHELVLGSLPRTRVHRSPHGHHYFYRWPDGLDRPRGPMFGKVVTRWPLGDTGQGYVVGPGSTLVNGKNLTYSVAFDTPIAELPRAWAEAAFAFKPPRTKQSEARPLAEPFRYGEGLRHDAIRDKAHNLYRTTGVAGHALFAMVFAWYEQTCEPYSPPLDPVAEVNRAIGDVSQFPVDEPTLDIPFVSEPEPPVGRAFVWLPELISELNVEPLDPYLVDGFIVNNGLTIIAGHPKSMKSMALLQAGFAYASRQPFLDMDPLENCYPVFAYVTEEGSRYEMKERLRVLVEEYDDALHRTVISYLKEFRFTRSGLDRMETELSHIEDTYRLVCEETGKPLRVLLAMDPLRDFFPLGAKWSENDAQVMNEIKMWCRTLLKIPWLSIVLVHHLRKATDGTTGLEMAGSGATYGAADCTVTWKKRKERDEENRDFDAGPLAEVRMSQEGRMYVESRGDAPWNKAWYFNSETGLLQLDAVRLTVTKTVEAIIRSNPGISTSVGAVEAGKTPDQFGAEARRLKARGVVASVGGGKGGPGNVARWYPAGSEPPDLRLIDDLEEVGTDPLHSLNDD